ncbi:MAG: hypothetical protein ACKO6N_20880 [Myxococcota bacterium]
MSFPKPLIAVMLFLSLDFSRLEAAEPVGEPSSRGRIAVLSTVPEVEPLQQPVEQPVEKPLQQPVEQERVAPGLQLLLAEARAAREQALRPLAEDDDMFTDQPTYRYDFSERHLSFGLNMAGGLANGPTLNAFPYGGVVTPYFRGAFGDGNALQLDLNLGINPISGASAQWLYFRTPIMAGSLVSGYVALIAPTLSFRYDIDLGASISKRSPVALFVSFGLGPAFTYGSSALTSNGSVNGTGETYLTNIQLFADVLPAAGLKLRLGEFAALEVGSKLHLVWPIMANVNNTGWVSGRPFSVPEFWIEASRWTEFYLGFSYDFG